MIMERLQVIVAFLSLYMGIAYGLRRIVQDEGLNGPDRLDIFDYVMSQLLALPVTLFFILMARGLLSLMYWVGTGDLR